MAPELDIVEVRRLANPKHADQLMLAAIEAALAGVRLDPHHEIEHLAIGLLPGFTQFANVSPVHADIMDGSSARMRCRVAEALAQEFDVFLSGHFPRSHGEFAMLHAATPHHARDLHVVRRVQERHRRLLVTEQTIQVHRVARISTEEAMRAELPDVTGLAYRRKRKPVSLDVIRRVCALSSKSLRTVDLDWLETGDGDVEAFRNEELGEFGEFDSQTLPVPPGTLGDFVIRE